MKRLTTLVLACLLFVNSDCYCEERFKVVTTLSTFAALVRTVGGERVEVASIAPPSFNPHFIEPRPSDVLKLKRAQLFVHGGLDLEAWRGPLVDAVGRSDMRAGGDRQLDLSQGIALLEVPSGQISRADGDIHLFGNPHYWIDPQNGELMASAIASKLSELDPESRNLYQDNLSRFVVALNQKIEKWHSQLMPIKNLEVIGYHNEWIYLMNFAGLKMKYFLEPKPGIPPSPKQIEFLVNYMKEGKITAIIQATYFPTEAGSEVGQRTGAKLLLLCQNVGEIPQASDYISMVDYNISQIVGALHRG